jgi:hypothetical protein
MSSDLPTQLPATTNAGWLLADVSRTCSQAQNGYRGAIIWFFGSPGSSKAMLACALEDSLHRNTCRTFLLDTSEQQVIGKIANCGVFALLFDTMPDSESKKHCQRSET